MQRAILILACVFIWDTLTAQAPEPRVQYPFVRYTPKDGLINSRVRKAFQDSRGKMYFLTYSGLSVYDGARFKNYTRQNGLRSDLVNDILEVTPDSLLVATNNSGMNALVKGQLKDISGSLRDCPVVNYFLKGQNDTTYISSDNGLYSLTGGKLTRLSTVDPSGNEIIFLGRLVSWKNFIVFTTNDFSLNKGLFLYNTTTNTIIDALPEVYVGDLKKDPAGLTWLSAAESILNIDTTELNRGKLVLRKTYAFYAQNASPGYILFNKQNELFIFSGQKGMTLYRKDGSVLRISSPEPSTATSQYAFFDRENILWICYDGNGVYKLSNSKLLSISAVFPENPSGIDRVYSFNPDSTWFIMKNGQWILSTGLRNKTFEPSPPTDATPILQTKSHLYALSMKSLYRTPRSSMNATVLPFKKLLTISGNTAFGTCIEDPYQNLIIYENRRLFILRNEQQFFSYPIKPYNRVEGMYIDKQKYLWLITRLYGMEVLSIHPGDTANYLRQEFHFINELEKASPRCMVVDHNEVLWIGTRNDGLMAFVFDGKSLKKTHHFKIHTGLTDNFITSLSCDRENNIIIGTQTGLDRLIRTGQGNYRLENVTKSNNIFTYIVTTWTDANNNAFALTNSGAVLQVSPLQPEESRPSPQLFIEEMKVNGESIGFSSVISPLKYYQRNISFSIAAPTFLDERQVQYSYRLSGHDNNDWSEPGTNADINLLNLSPGNYTLEIKAYFPSTSYGPRQMAFSFKILPPWWQTWWFRIPAALLLLTGVIYAIRFYYRGKLEKEKSILERQQAIEKERTRIATDMHDDLGAGLSRIKFLSETMGIKKQLQQPIEEDISSIRQYSHEMIDKMGEIVWALNEKNDSLSDLLSYTRSYTVEYLSQHGIQCTVNAPDHFPSNFVSGEYRRNIYLVVKEALHNIVKHAQATAVSVTITIGDQLNIIIADNGRGFIRENIRPYSNGLSNMKKRMEDIGGSLQISHENGTTVKLLSPVP